MKFITLYIFSVLLVTDPGKIALVNSAKKEARQAYVDGDYKKAVEKYTYLTKTLEVQEDEVTLNLANAYFHTNDTTNALHTYQSLLASSKSHIRSKAHQQLGIMQHRDGKLEESLNNFKQAIKADASNVDAKFNYEMLKKKLEEEKKKQEEKNKNKPKEPSAYAKKLKQQADNMLGNYRFEEANALMNEGAKRDPSVLYYEDFMNRLKEVVTINKSK